MSEEINNKENGKDEKVWTFDETKDLIIEYETNPDLWDVSLSNYSNR